jgi:hypothetical protein
MKRLATLLLAPVSALSLTQDAASQCHEWAHDFALSGLDGRVHAMATFDDGQGPVLYVGGDFGHAGELVVSGLARWDGTHWTQKRGELSGGGVRAFALYDDGSGTELYAAGGIYTASGQPANGIAKWNGTSWSPLGVGSAAGVSGQIYDLCVYDDGAGAKLYAVGIFLHAGGQLANNIARWGPNGWEAFTNGAAGYPYALEVFDDGSGPKLVVAGEFPEIGSVLVQNIATFDGSTFAPLGAGVDGIVWDLKVFQGPSGPELIAGGEFTHAGGAPAGRIASWSHGAWSELAGGLDARAMSLVTFDEGAGERLFVGGYFAQAGGLQVPHLARWDGVGWSAPGTGDDVNPTAAAPGFGVHDDGTGPKLYVGTDVRIGPSSWTHGIGRWTGAAFEGVGPPRNNILDNPVSSFVVFDDGTGPALHASGLFTKAGGNPVGHIARWNGARWEELGGGLPDGPIHGPQAVVDHGAGERLYAYVPLTSPGTQYSELRCWDGATWTTIATTSLGSFIVALSAYDDGSGPALYVGGTFQTLGGVAAANIARFDGSTWSAVGGGLSGASPYAGVQELSVQDLGLGPVLIASGLFESAGGQPALNIARWDGSSWSAFGSGLATAPAAFAVYDDGSGPALFTAGPGTPQGGLQRWDGSTWSQVPGSPPNWLTALAVFDDGSGPSLYVGGNFSLVGSLTARGLARWNGSVWSSPGYGVTLNGTGGAVWALQVFDDGTGGGADLFVGGNFTATGGVESPWLGKFHGCAGPIASFCHGDGGASPCPCWNDGAAGHGCANSANPAGAQLATSGSTNPDTLVLSGSGEPSGALSIFLQGDQQTAHTPFGDGLRCLTGSLVRLYAHNSSGGNVQAPSAGELPVSAQSAALGDPILAGSVRYYQVYYRDPQLSFCAAPQGSSFNVTNGVVVHW